MFYTIRRTPAFPRHQGFALPWILLMLAILGMLASVGFLLAWRETRASEATLLGTRMFGAVDGALAQSLAASGPMTTGAVSVTTGAGVVRVDRVRLLDLGYGSSLWRVSASAATASFGPELTLLAGSTDPPLFPAPLTAFGGVSATGAAGSIDGTDASTGCGTRYPGPLAAIAAITAATGPGLVLNGSPPVRAIQPSETVRRITYIEWAEIAAGQPARDAVIPPDPWPVPGGWPVIELATAGAAVGALQSGQGVLIAPGDLDLADGFRWRGLVLVGGVARVSGLVRIRGVLAAGLAGPASPAVDLGSANVSIQFDACAVEQAARQVVLPPWVVPRSWRELF